MLIKLFRAKEHRYLRRLILTLSLFFSGSVFVSPYFSILNFKKAIDSKDYNLAKNYINFPTVRSSLKTQIKFAVDSSFSKNQFLNPYTALGLVLIDPLINSIVDSTVTPQGLNILLREGLISNSKHLSSNSNNSTRSNLNKTTSIAYQTDPKINLYYISLNRFMLSTSVPNSNKPIEALWSRNGIFHWHLYSITIPNNLLQLNDK